MIRATIPMPPTTNNAYANAWVNGKLRRIKSPEARAYAAVVGSHLLSQGYVRKHGDALEGPLAFFATFYHHRKGRWDVANREKLLVDAMCQHLGIDDSAIVFMQLKKAFDKDNPRCELVLGTVEEVEG